MLTSNARDDDRWDAAKSILRLGVREAICVPMQGRYDVVGVIYIDTSLTPQRILQQGSANKFTQEHLKLMIAIAHQAALAVEDTTYYKAMVQAERLAAVGQTIASLSHHIKNILQGIRGGSYLIEMGLKDHAKAIADGDVDVEAAEKAVDHHAQRLGHRREEPGAHLGAGDGHAHVQQGARARAGAGEPQRTGRRRRRADESAGRAKPNVELVWQPAPTMPTLMFDPEAMHRAMLNIVTNAIDACDEREDGRVEVSTQYEPRRSRWPASRVVDNGSGIATDDLEKIFTVFVSRKGGRGTGLGLPVSQKILKEHGGRIRVESQLGQGSRFTLEFPATMPQPAPGHTDARHVRGSTNIERFRPTARMADALSRRRRRFARRRSFATSKFTTRSARRTIAPPNWRATRTSNCRRSSSHSSKRPAAAAAKMRGGRPMARSRSACCSTRRRLEFQRAKWPQLSLATAVAVCDALARELGSRGRGPGRPGSLLPYIRASASNGQTT